ncbi:hypothetical protein [Bacillus sp. BP-3]|uniref:hypothetical protein n=1 Tax=Bacillus sp. BP-3 TaxID=3022773 RepID=UPI00232E407F|nr:hypothetical protein [Bacillus sp. BP-3]MDC2866529.1 hypothetical protein [Bacillus sp. BP-3]
MTNLSKQVYIYSLSTDVFFTDEERKIKTLKDRYHDKKRLSSQEDNIKAELSKLTRELSDAKKEDNALRDEESKAKKKKQIEFIESKITSTQRQLDYLKWLSEEVFKDKKVSNASLKRELNDKIVKYKETRRLNPLRLNPSQTIALFESTLTRKLKMKTNKLSEKLIVVEIYNYEVFKSLLSNGFYHRDSKYVYFSSSSGQIRDKKAVFIKEDAWDAKQGGIENSITAGLSIDDINNNGGMSVNKFLAYKALASSASEKWKGFNIDRCIVVDDVKVKLENRTVDYIPRDTFEVDRQTDRTVNLEITDGAGMMLPSVSEELFGEGVYKNMQFRLPWMKGCLSSVSFDKFTNNPKVTDIYGKEWDIVKDGISIIFFKSQFKMWKHFINKDNVKESWKKYKENFKKYKCEAAFMNVEDDSIPNAKLNYQYLQSLVHVSDEDLIELARMTNDDLSNMGSDADTMIRVIGADDENDDKNEFQQAINLYPALLNDKNTKEAIKSRKKKMLKEAKAGKLSVEGKYTYILPDWYAVMENIFQGIENPKGLLLDGQVSSTLYEQGKVDLMRSPALSFEHVIRENVRSDKMKEWYITKAVHISADDLLPKILQADFDGDKILVTPLESLIRVSKGNAKRLDVVPLEYEMGVSEPKFINPENIFESLTIAFKANIGIISNTISKLYNKDNFDVDADYRLIKQLCSYNNHVIDMAKTLDVVKVPPEIKKVWNEYNQQKLPYFFTFAKSKEVVMDKNNSTVNRLEDVIIDKRIHFKSVVGKFDYKKLMWTPSIKDDAYIIDKETDNEIINTYTYLDQNKRDYMPSDAEDYDGKKPYIYIVIREKLLDIYPDAHKVADVLVRYLFKEKDSEYKKTLWESFGVEVVNSIRKNVHKEIDCAGCGITVCEPRQRQVRCDECQDKYHKQRDAYRKRKEREVLKRMSA